MKRTSGDYLAEFHQRINKPKNPAIIEAEKRGRNMGFETGVKFGREQATNFFLKWIEDLESVKGIGPKTTQNLRNEFYKKYGKK